jgi:modulator of FtsH protease HflC
MNRLIIIGVAALAVLYVVFSSLYIVNEREQAVVLRFGQIIDVKTAPGIYFKVPTNIVDSVQIIDDRLLRYDIANMNVQVSGGKFYVVDAFLTYEISDARLFRERVQGNLQLAEERIRTRFDAALRQVYGLREFNAALSEERTVMMEEAQKLIHPDMELLGINVLDVRILRTDLDADVSVQTFDRMKAERLAEAAFLRARGQEAAQTLKAIADRQAVEIVAAARRDAEILRGEGDAERNRIFAAAYSANPEFFEFYRSMESYRTALGANTGTTMVLSPDSEFFRYFGDNTEVNLGTNQAVAGDAPLTPIEMPEIVTESAPVDTTLPADPLAPTPEAGATDAVDAPPEPAADATTVPVEPAEDATTTAPVDPDIETPAIAPTDTTTTPAEPATDAGTETPAVTVTQ